jgi:hypothetical protein
MGLGFCVGARANPKKVCTLPKGLTVRGPQPVSAPVTELAPAGGVWPEMNRQIRNLQLNGAIQKK